MLRHSRCSRTPDLPPKYVFICACTTETTCELVTDGWCAQAFMIDKADAEISAIKAAFPEAAIRICFFHVMQAWERWLKKTENGVRVGTCASYPFSDAE